MSMHYKETYRVYELVPDDGSPLTPDDFITAYNVVKPLDGVSFNNMDFKQLLLQFEGHVSPYDTLTDVIEAITQNRSKKHA